MVIVVMFGFGIVMLDVLLVWWCELVENVGD